MASFKDAQDREWTVRIDVNALKAVRDELDFDLLTQQGAEQLAKLAADPILLVATLYVLCKDQIDERELSPEEFGAAFLGEAIAEAVDALMEGMIGFFPERQRRILMRVKEKSNQAVEQALAKVEAALDSGEMDRTIEDLISSGVDSTNSPASSGSTPAP